MGVAGGSVAVSWGREVTDVEMAGSAAFPYLSSEALGAFTLLGSPVYIYSFATQRICWSNSRAWGFWNAATADELHTRELGPFSSSTEVRLNEYREQFRRGGERIESWTFYPAGQPTSALCRCSGVRLDGHDEAMLVEVHALKDIELPVSELRAIEALRHTPLKIALFSQDGEVLMRNPAAVSAFGELDRLQGPGTNHLKAIFAQESDYELLLREARQFGVGHITASMALEGWPVHSVQLSFVTDPVTGEPALLVAQQDISQLISVSRRLAASEEALDAVLMLNVAPALVLSADGTRVLNANHAAQALLGTGAAAGHDLAGLVSDMAQFDYLRGALLTQGTAHAVLSLRNGRGSTFWCSVSGARIRYENRDALVLLIANVDQLYQTAADLEAALDIERRTTRMQRRFMAIASHEFRTPLAVIDSTAQQIERKAETMSPDQIQARARRVRGEIRRLLRLFDETLNRAEANLGSMGYAPQEGQLADVIASVAGRFAEGDPDLKITLDLPQLPAIPLDEGLMEQAFTNLIGNAVKYSDPPGRIEIEAVAGIDELRITIRDHGIGISPAERETVFDERVRGSNVGERPGTGLGLALVRQIVELHGGRIEVVDTPDGPGTTIRLTLPRP